MSPEYFLHICRRVTSSRRTWSTCCANRAGRAPSHSERSITWSASSERNSPQSNCSWNRTRARPSWCFALASSTQGEMLALMSTSLACLDNSVVSRGLYLPFLQGPVCAPLISLLLVPWVLWHFNLVHSVVTCYCHNRSMNNVMQTGSTIHISTSTLKFITRYISPCHWGSVDVHSPLALRYINVTMPLWLRVTVYATHAWSYILHSVYMYSMNGGFNLWRCPRDKYIHLPPFSG